MHSSARRFFEDVAKRWPPSGAVLEAGSYNVNGGIRDLFAGCEYTGVDCRSGPGVDVVADCHDLPFYVEVFDWVVSTSMIEHDPKPWLSVAEMRRVLRRGGLLVLAAPGFGWPRHNEPIDCYRFTVDAFRGLLDGMDILHLDELNDGDGPDVRAVARKL